MKPILEFTILRHHNVEMPPFTVKQFIENETALYPVVLQLVKNAIEEDVLAEISTETWATVQQQLHAFWNGDIDKLETTFTAVDEDDEEKDILVYCERGEDGHINMLYNPEGMLDKYENRWFKFSIVEDAKVQQKKTELEKKSKEELIEQLSLHSI